MNRETYDAIHWALLFGDPTHRWSTPEIQAAYDLAVSRNEIVFASDLWDELRRRGAIVKSA